MKKKFAASVVDAYLVDKPQDDSPSTYMIYFVEGNRQHWKRSEISTMEIDFVRSKLLQGGCIGAVVSFPDILRGYSHMLRLDPRKGYASMGTSIIRNIDLKIKEGSKNRYSVDESKVDVALCAVAKDTIFNHSVRTLRNRGLTTFKEEICPKREFRSRYAGFV